VRLLAILLLSAGGLALTGAGHARTPTRHLYTARELSGIVDPKPTLPKWSFAKGDPYLYPTPAHAPAFTLREFFGESPTNAARAHANKLRKAGFQIGRHMVWNGRNTQARRSADATVFAFLFRTASGARVAFSLLVGTGSREQGARKLPARLGEESVGSYEPSGSNGNEQARYFWRRGNLVISAAMTCSTECRFPVVPPARTYADQMDARAKRTS
jgi:hypothetical protein